MKRHLYFLTLWVATLSMLLSTMMMHHHHAGKVCLVMEKCVEDGNVNDEHTEHRENEQAGCQVHQMHHFLINAKVVKSIKKHILDGNQQVAVLPLSSYEWILDQGLVISEWQELTQPLSQKAYRQHYRRGPPLLS